MAKKQLKKNRKSRAVNKAVKRVKPKRPKGIRAVKPEEFRRIMDRIELIDKEAEKEKELFDIKMNSLRLEKEYLWNIIKPKKKRDQK